MTKKRPVDLGKFFKNDALEFLAGTEEQEVAERAQALGLPLVHLDPHMIGPDPEQLRRLPLVGALSRAAERGDRAAQAQLDRLRELGESMRQLGQIQPVIVYRDADVDDPAVTHRLLNGQRRWSAALVAGLPTVWAVEVPRPSTVNRVLHQYAENERREEFTDMERAWSMQALKSALEAETGATVAWDVIEQRMQISRSRRNDLMRLLRFPAEGQQIIQQHGWSEWTLRRLHQAMQDGTIDDAMAVDMLKVLAEQVDINAPLVQALVEQYIGGSATAEQPVDDQIEKGVTAAGQAGTKRRTSQRTLVDVHQRLAKMSRAIEQFHAHARHLGVEERQQARREATALRDKLQALLDALSA